MATRLQPWMGDLLALFGPEECESLLWREAGSGELEFTVFCSDTFAWACADCEPISAGDLPALERAKADLPEGDWPTLWVARKRGMRPMRRWLERCGGAERHLFEAAGPASLGDGRRTARGLPAAETRQGRG